MADGPGVTPEPERDVGFFGVGDPVGRIRPVVAVVGELDGDVLAGVVAVVVVTGSVVVVVGAAVVAVDARVVVVVDSRVVVVAIGAVVAVVAVVPVEFPPEPEPLQLPLLEPEPVVPVELFGSDVEVVDLPLWLLGGVVDDVVVALLASGDSPAGPGDAMATPPR